MTSASTYVKSIVAGSYSLVSGMALVSGDGLNLTEVLTCTGSAMLATGLVYQFPNKTPVDELNDPNTSTQDTGFDAERAQDPQGNVTYQLNGPGSVSPAMHNDVLQRLDTLEGQGQGGSTQVPPQT